MNVSASSAYLIDKKFCAGVAEVVWKANTREPRDISEKLNLVGGYESV